MNIVVATLILAIVTFLLVIITFLMATATCVMACYTRRSAESSELTVQEMKADREERNKPKVHLLQHRSEGWPFSLDYPLYLRIDGFHRHAYAKWREFRWNMIIIRNVGKGETGPGIISKIKYDSEKPETTIADDLEGFRLRSILPGESYAKLFAVQKRDPEKEDTPLIHFEYRCEHLAQAVKYPPVGKEDWFKDVYPETRVRIVGKQDFK